MNLDAASRSKRSNTRPDRPFQLDNESMGERVNGSMTLCDEIVHQWYDRKHDQYHREGDGRHGTHVFETQCACDAANKKHAEQRCQQNKFRAACFDGGRSRSAGGYIPVKHLAEFEFESESESDIRDEAGYLRRSNLCFGDLL